MSHDHNGPATRMVTNDRLSSIHRVTIISRTRVLQICREQIDGTIDVLDVGHLVNGVHIPSWNREGDRGGTGPALLHGAGIGAASWEDFELVGDVLLFGDVAKMAYELGMCQMR